MFKPAKLLVTVFALLVLMIGATTATAMVCDVDNDGDVDRIDISLIFAARNIPATGPDDPRDADGDGNITVLDGRRCTVSCTLPGCTSPPTNNPPTADAGPDQTTVLVGDTVVLDGNGSYDIDGDPLTFSWSFTSVPAGSAAALADPSAIMPTFVVDLPGSYVVQLIVDDGQGGTASDSVSISTGNSPPVANAGPDQTVFVGESVTLNGSASSDADGDPLAYAWSFASKPAGSAAILSNPNVVMPSFTVDVPGNYVVELIVNDGQVDSVADAMTVSTENSAPVAAAGPDQFAFVGDNVTLDGSGSSDIDGDPLTFTWDFFSVPAGSSATFSDPTAVMPYFSVDQPGTYVAELIVNDGALDSVPDTVSVTTQNSPPVADAGPDQTVLVGDTVILDGSGSSDVDGDPLTYAWALTTVPAGSAASLDDPGATYPSFTADVFGTYVVQLIVNDGNLDSSADTVTITTENSAPVADAGPDQTAMVGESVTLNGSASSDVDGDPLTFSWSFTSRPAGSAATLSDPTSVMPSFTIDLPDTYVAQLIVDDGNLDSAPDTVVVTTQNSPPTAEAGPDQSVHVGASVQLEGTGSSDIDGDPLTFSWSLTSVPAGSTAVLNDPTSVSPTFTADLVGTYEVELIVNDGTEDSTPDTVVITSLNSTPIADAGPDQSAQGGASVQLDGSGSSDTDGDPLTYSWDLITVPAGSSAALNDPSSTTPTFTADLVGTYIAELIVNDGTDDSTPDTVEITVSALPTLSIDDVSQLEGDAGTTDFIFTISLSQTSAQNVTVTVNILDDTTTAADYSAFPATDVTINAGNLSNTVTIPVNGELLVELDETFFVNLSSPVNATIADGQGLGTILNDDSATLSIDDITISEGDSGTTDYTFTVQLDAAVDAAVELTYTTADGTASTTDNDYTAATDTLTFVGNVGEPQTLTVVVNGDLKVELDETFLVNLSGLNAAGRDVTFADSQGEGTILNDDSATVSIDDVAIAEGNSGTSNMTFTVSLDAPVDTAIDLDYASADGTATSADNDYTPVSDSLSLATESLSQTLIIPIVGDGKVELDETLLVTLANLAANGRDVTVSDSQGQGTVLNDDNAALTINDISIAEGDSGTTSFNFTVTLNAEVDGPVSVDYATADGTATVVDNDYSAASNTLNFLGTAGEALAVSVNVNGDTDVEPDETFLVNLSNVQAAGRTVYFADSQGQGTILNDDAVVNVITLSPVTLNLPTLASSSLTVGLSSPAGTGGLTVTLASDNPSVASIPASVFIAEGNSSTTATVTTGNLTGTAQISASAAGFTGDTSTVNVAARSMTLSLEGPLVGIARTISGTVNLSTPAPAGGVNVSLVSLDTGVATVAPANVSIPAGSSQASFDVTGVAAGTTDISASASGYAPANATVTTTSSLISLATGVIVAPEQTVGVAFSLSTPAPTGGVTVNFTTSNPAIATITPSVFVPAGQQVAASNPQLTGVSIGAVQIYATAIGFAPDTKDATVTIGISFNPTDLDVVESTTENITLNLSAPAPTGGLTLNLSSDDSGVASVPASIIIPIGQTSGQVPVTGESVGSTTIRATATGIAEATASINVTPAPPITLSDYTIGDDLQLSAIGILGAAAPAGNLQVTITSADPARLLLSTSATDQGSASITVQVNAGIFSTEVFYLQALDDNGTVDYTANAPGYASGSGTVTLTPSGFYIQTNNITTTSFSDPSTVRLRSIRLNPVTLTSAGVQSIRAGFSVDVDVTSSDTTVGTITTSPVTFTGNMSLIDTYFDPNEAGVSTISISTPAGFETTSNLAQQRTATVTAPGINFNNLSVGDDLQTAGYATLGATPPAPVDVTVTISDPSIAVISTDATTVGSDSQVIPGIAGAAIGNIYVQGLSQGTTTLTIEAPGYETDINTITVTPSGFYIQTGDINTTSFSGLSTVRLRSIRLNPVTLTSAGVQSIRAGFSVDVDVTSSDTTVGTITTSPVTFTGNMSLIDTYFDPNEAGVSTISISTPAGFETTSNLAQQRTATVTAPGINFNNLSVGDDLQTAGYATLGATPPAPVDVTVTISDPSIAVISTDATTVGSDSQVIPGIAGAAIGNIYVQGLSQGTTTLTIEAPGYETDINTITVTPSGFYIQTNSFSTTTFSSDYNVRIRSARLTPGTLTYSTIQSLRAGFSVDVDMTSSDTTVGTITSPNTFTSNLSLIEAQFDPVTAGTTTLNLITPVGFETTSNQVQQITATVNAPDITLSDALVGQDLQTGATYAYLAVAPPGPVDVTLTVSSGAIATISTDPSTAGSTSITFPGVTSTSVGPIYIQGRSLGSTNITVQAAGYNDEQANVTVDPAGFMIASPSVINTTASAGNSNVQVRAARLNPTTLNYAAYQYVRGGLTVNVEVTSSNPSVGTITTSPVIFDNAQTYIFTEFDPLAAGTTTIAVQTPPGFSTPSNNQQITANVSP